MSKTMRAAPTADRFGFWLALYYAALLAVSGIQVPFFPLWLSSRGLDARTIGVVLATPIVVRIFVVPIANRIADRAAVPRGALIVASVAATLTFAIVGFASGFGAILLTVALAAMAFTPVGALVDAYAMRGLGERKVAYGAVRLWGSVSFLAANLASGLILAVIPRSGLVWLIVAALAVMAGISIGLRPLDAAPAAVRATASQLRAWLSPRFLAIAAAASLIQASHAIYYGFSAVAWTGKGYGTETVGTLWAIGVASEIAFFALSGRFRVSPSTLIGLGAAGAVIRWAAMALDPPSFLLPFLQCLHAFSFGATHLGSVQFAAQSAETRGAAAAQADFGTILALGGMLATAASGVLFHGLGAYAYFVMAGLAALGAIVLRIGIGASGEC